MASEFSATMIKVKKGSDLPVKVTLGKGRERVLEEKVFHLPK